MVWLCTSSIFDFCSVSGSNHKEREMIILVTFDFDILIFNCIEIIKLHFPHDGHLSPHRRALPPQCRRTSYHVAVSFPTGVDFNWEKNINLNEIWDAGYSMTYYRTSLQWHDQNQGWSCKKSYRRINVNDIQSGDT